MSILLKVLKYIIKIKGDYENIFRFVSVLFLIFEKYISKNVNFLKKKKSVIFMRIDTF